MTESAIDLTKYRHAANEAASVLDTGLRGRVLEPSPPAVNDEFLADDPPNVAVDTAADKTVSLSVDNQNGSTGLTWESVVADQPDLAPWAAERWLAGFKPLDPVPTGLVRSRLALHRLATYVIAPARHQANGKFGLRWTLGGFGTPFFGDDMQVRVHDDLLVVQEADGTRHAPISSLAAAAQVIGSTIDSETAAEHDSPAIGDINEDLAIDKMVTRFLDRWWGMATAALERIRAESASIDPSRVQLWPGHFDPAIEMGDENRRASYGASPGDATSDEPYIYVSAWWPDRLDLAPNPYWNADGFVGAVKPYSELVSAADPVATAADFYRTGRQLLAEAADL